jgi:hypothetical protein
MNYSNPTKPSTPKSPPFEKSSNGAPCHVRTFTSFIQSCFITNSPRGDFIADAKTLISAGVFPAIDSWGDLYAFMMRRRACPEAVTEGRKLWAQFRKSQTAAVPGKNRRAQS